MSTTTSGPSGQSTPSAQSAYATGLADASYDRYHRAAVRTRRLFRLSETLLLVVSAAIPVAAVLSSGDTRLPAVLGGVAVVITGLRSAFHWQDDYVRYTQAREAIEAERRLYRTGAPPYSSPAARDRRLVAAVTRVEQQERGTWVQLVGPTADPSRDSRPSDPSA